MLCLCSSSAATRQDAACDLSQPTVDGRDELQAIITAGGIPALAPLLGSSTDEGLRRHCEPSPTLHWAARRIRIR